MRSWTRWSVWLCLSLMLWTAGAESTHQHPSQSKATSSCSICVVAHSANPSVSSSHAAPVFAAIRLLQERRCRREGPVRFF